MSYFETVIQPIIATATHINHYPQFNRFEFMENEKLLVSLYTQRSTKDLAKRYNLPAHEYIQKNYTFILKLKVELCTQLKSKNCELVKDLAANS